VTNCCLPLREVVS